MKFSGPKSGTPLKTSPKQPVGKPALTADVAAFVGQVKSLKADDQKREEIRTSRGPKNFTICLDATLSMDGLIDNAKRSIGQIIQKMNQETDAIVNIQICAYRNYNASGKVMDSSEMTNKVNSLTSFLASISTDGGLREDGEAMEVPLEHVLKQPNISAVLVATDASANDESTMSENGKRGRTAYQLAPLFKEKGIPIHVWMVPPDVNDQSIIEPRLRRIAKLSGGQFGVLDGSKAMIDMAVLAMLKEIKGTTGVKEYMAKNPQLRQSAQNFGNALLLTDDR